MLCRETEYKYVFTALPMAILYILGHLHPWRGVYRRRYAMQARLCNHTLGPTRAWVSPTGSGMTRAGNHIWMEVHDMVDGIDNLLGI